MNILVVMASIFIKNQREEHKKSTLAVKKTMQDMPMQDHHFYEMMQHQIIRIAALGITGFDSPVAFESIQEAGYSLEGIREWYYAFCQTKSKSYNASNTVTFSLSVTVGGTAFTNFWSLRHPINKTRSLFCGTFE